MKPFIQRLAERGLLLVIGTVVSFAQNQIAGAGYTAPPLLVAPGQIVTLFTAPLNVPDAVAERFPLPTTLSGVSVSVRVPGVLDSTGYPTFLPILRVYSSLACTQLRAELCPNTQITVQIPMEGVCVSSISSCSGTFIDIPPLLIVNVRANNFIGADATLVTSTEFPHLLNSCDSIFGPSTGDCHDLITHADGKLVSLTKPAIVGETITIYAVGLNDRALAPVRLGRTGYPADTPVALNPKPPVLFSYRLAPAPGAQFGFYAPTGNLVSPEWAGLTAGYVGLFQINVMVPPMLPGTVACDGAYNTGISLLSGLSGTVYLCVQPAEVTPGH